MASHSPSPGWEPSVHRLLQEQLIRCGIDPEEGPASFEAWRTLLEALD